MSASADVRDAGAEARRCAVAEVARALAHPARVRMLELLCERQSCLGRELVRELGLAPSTVSEHLRILREAGLVTARDVPPSRCFSLAEGRLALLRAFLDRLAAAQGSLCDPLMDTRTAEERP